MMLPQEALASLPPEADRVFVSADFSQLETWLTAHFSKDLTMQQELENQLKGGPKIHALNGARIYKCPVEEAKTHLVPFKGNMVPAYTGGKHAGHAFNYGMEAPHMAKTWWISMKEAESILETLSDKYTDVVAWRDALADHVYGKIEYRCPCNCGFTVYNEAGTKCHACSTRGRPIKVRYSQTLIEPARVLYTPFKRRRWYLGRRSDGRNALASQLPQSSGASIFYRCLGRLAGYDFYNPDVPWPQPPLAAFWSPRLSTYNDAYAPFETFVGTGTYDSFLVECPRRYALTTLNWLLWTMEQPWPELGNLRLPAEASIGLNWMDATKQNPHGLIEVEYQPFTATWEAA